MNIIISNLSTMSLFYFMPVIFFLGVIAIALEDIIRVNKAATAVGMSILLWLMFLLDASGIFSAHKPDYIANFIEGFPHFAALSPLEQALRYIEFSITEALGDVSSTLFFVLGSMVIIELLDAHGSFGIISQSIRTTSKRRLLWILSCITFFLSMVLGNLATVIIMIAVMRKLISDKSDRLTFASMSVIAANAGGAASPIGDVTTLLLWTGGNISPVHQLSYVFPASVLTLVIPLAILSLTIPKTARVESLTSATASAAGIGISPRFQKTLLWIGIATLALVPVLQSLFHLPPFMGVLLGLSVLWIFTDRKYARASEENLKNLKLSSTFSRIDLSTILFFLGILMSVQALNSSGFLTVMANGMNSVFPQSDAIAVVLGLCSSFLDNVALVAAAMGMYPIAEIGAFMSDGSFWTFLAYTAVTGGSILIIGSASGVTAMGMEKIPFGYYLKKFTPLALLGFAAGSAYFLLIGL